VEVGDKSFETPAVAMPIGRGANQDVPADAVRGVNELHRSVSTADLRQSMRGDGSKITKKLRRDARRTNDTEVNIVFTTFTDGHRIGRQEMEHLVDVVSPFTDIHVVPLMPGLIGSVNPDAGRSDSAYRGYRKTVDRYIDMVRQRLPGAPIMGTLPPLPWEFNRNLMDLYGQEGIRALSINLNRRRLTADRQLSVLEQLMQHLARQDLVKGTFTYLLNPDPYGPGLSEGYSPAADVAGFGMGIDVIGDCHVSPGGYNAEDAAPTFRLLNPDTYVYEHVTLNELGDRLPESTGLNRERVVSRSKDSPKQSLYQMQKLVNMEQMGFAAKALREMERSDLYELLTAKSGITNGTKEAYEEVRQSFDQGTAQTALGDY
jgi:hypothetical protein